MSALAKCIERDYYTRAASEDWINGGPGTRTKYLYDQAGHLIAETSDGGTSYTQYLWLGDTPVAVIKPGSANLYYIHTDHLDTPRLIANQTPATVWRWDNDDPFGANMANANPSGLGAFVFNPRLLGQYFDSETNYHYNNYRDYSPEIGRYVESDAIGLRGGLNTYPYVFNDPLRLSDSTGECPWCAAAVIGGVIGGGVNLIQQFGGSAPINWTQFVIATGAGAVSGASGAWVGALTTSVLQNALANAVIGASANFAQQSLSNLAACQPTPVYQGVGWNIAMGYAFGALGGGAGQILTNFGNRFLNQSLQQNLVSLGRGYFNPNASAIGPTIIGAGAAFGNAVSNVGNFVPQPNNQYWY